MKQPKYLAWTLGLALAAMASIPLVAKAQTITVTPTSVDGFVVRSNGVTPSPTLRFTNDGRTLLVLTNNQTSNVGAIVRTNATSMSAQGMGTVTLSDTLVVLPSGTTVIIGPFAQGRYDGTNGVQVFLTSTTLISATAIRVPQ